MKKFLFFLFLFQIMVMPSIGQTMRINMGDVTYAITASQAGEMTYNDGTTLTVCGKTYTLSELTNITIDDTAFDDNLVDVHYDGSSAKVVISGNLSPYLSATVKGAHVCIHTSDDLPFNVTYILAGNSSNGSFYMDGDHAMGLVFNQLSLINPDSAAINIQNGKLIGVRLADGTTNYLADGLTNVVDDGSDGHKAAFYVDGHTSWTGSGALTIVGNVKHGYVSDEYTLLNEGLGSITVTSAASDGFHINQYFKMEGGTVTISSTGDGIDVEKKKSDKEDNGKMMIDGGTLSVTTSGNATKALKCESDMVIIGGVITAITTGTAVYEAAANDISSNACAKCDGSFTMKGGTLTLTSTGDGGKGINSTGIITISGGQLTAVTTGDTYEYGTLDSKPHPIKSDGDIILSGGEILSCGSADKGTAFKTDFNVLTNGATLMGIGGKATTGSTASTHSSKKYTGVNVKGGSTLSYDGVTFKIPDNYNNASAKIIVSSPSM